MAGDVRTTLYGDFASDFAEDRLIDLCDPRHGIQTGPFGSQLHQKDYVKVGTPIITVEHLGENRILHEGVPRVSDADRARLARYSLRTGDIVFSRVGSVDRRALVGHQEAGWLFSGRCLRVRPDAQRIDPAFLSYFFGLAAFREHIRAIAVGATMPSLNTSLLSDVLVPHPRDIGEQRAIAHTLGTLDDKIDLNRRTSETLEAIARALFRSWFVDFDPVRAKSEGRDPGLPQLLADLFPDTFEDSELGEIPKGWGTLRLGDLLVLDKGLSYKGQFLGETGMPMVNLGCFLGRGRFAETAMKHYSGEFRDRHVVRPRDLLIANTDLTQKREVIGSPALIPPQEGLDELLFTHHVFAARFREGQAHWKLFVYFSLLQEEFRERATGFATGTTVLALPRDAILGLQFSAPPPALISAFGSMVLSAVEGQWKALDESATLATVRDTLLPKLISGELRVKDAERIVAGAGV